MNMKHYYIKIIVLVIVFHVNFTHSKKCLNVNDVYARYARYQGEIVNITLLTTERITHQISTYAFKILLEEMLGYQNVNILRYDDHFDIYNLIQDTKLGKLKRWNINLEVWIPMEYDVQFILNHGADTRYTRISDVGPPGKFGWFTPKKTYFRGKAANDIDIYWSLFKNYSLISQFTLSERLQTYILNKSYEYRSNMRNCIKCTSPGVFKPKHCLKKPGLCAVLLASKYQDTDFIIEHIDQLKLFVEVIWVGSHLQEIVTNLTNHYYQSNEKKSVLILSWTPSEVIIPKDDFIPVSFPSCDVLMKQGINKNCRYDAMSLTKIGWEHLKKAASSAYTQLDLFEFNETNYEHLLSEYNEGLSVEDIACKWMKTQDEIRLKDKETIHIGGIFPLLGNASITKTAGGISEAALLAVEDINNSNLLENYQLKMIQLDGHCESNYVMKSFIDMLKFENLLGILGPACSETVEPLAGVSKLYNVLTISYSAEGVSFADRIKYPYFFRTIGENQHYVPVYRKFFQKMKVTKSVAALTEDGHKYTEYLSHMNDLLLDNKKFPRDRESVDIAKDLKRLQNKKARFIIVDVPDEVARNIMCYAYHLNMTGTNGYAWFLPDWFSNDWYNTTYHNERRNESIICTVEEMTKAINGYFSLSYSSFAPNNTVISVTNSTIEQWLQIYQNRMILKNKIASQYAGYAYDAMWTYALSVKQLLDTLPEAIYTLDKENTSKKLVDIIKKIDFIGVSGHIKFGASGSRFCVINIKQWINGTTTIVGSYDANVTNIDHGKLILNQSAIVWLNESILVDNLDLPFPQHCVADSFLSFIRCNATLIILNLFGVATLLMLLSVTIIFYKRKYEQKLLDQEKKFGLDLVRLNTLDEWEIPRENVVINRKLGQGAFGTVYGGEAYFSEKGWVGVAVKTLKIGSTTEEKLDFLSEAEIMKRFDHKNIVKLLGVCTSSEPVYTVMEFMLYGDLKTYLLARRHLINARSFEEHDEISSKKLTSMALDVARALSYLAEMKIVHRDIACRNCLLNAQRMVKLGDFGMTRMMYENDYYKFNRRGMLPVRWMAPESLGLGIFTPYSDIWSYGVLLYEIITFGSFPFQGKTNSEVLEFVKAGNVLEIPSGVKPQLEALIRSCWTIEPKRRPQASQIVEFIANTPRLLSPCLDVPLSSVEMCNSQSNSNTESVDDVPLPESLRKHSVERFNRLYNNSNNLIDHNTNLTNFIRQQSVSSAILSETDSVDFPNETIQIESNEPLLMDCSGNSNTLASGYLTQTDSLL